MTREEWQEARLAWDAGTALWFAETAKRPNRPGTVMLAGHGWSCFANNCPYRLSTGPCPTTGEPPLTYPGDSAEALEQTI